jgi:hypothetical protein
LRQVARRRWTNRRGVRLGALGAVGVLLLAQCQQSCAPAADPPAAVPVAPSVAPPQAQTPAPPSGPTTPPPAGVQFFEDFASELSMGRFDFESKHPVIQTQLAPQTWLADHSMSCGNPNTASERRTVHLDAPQEYVFYCAPGDDATKGHMMTSFSSREYAHIDFTPKQSFSNVSRVCVDRNMNTMGTRKWIQIAVIPAATFEANVNPTTGKPRLDYVMSDFEVANSFFAGARPTGGLIYVENEGSGQTFDQNGVVDSHDDGFRTDDRARRFKLCLVDNGNGTIQVEQERAAERGSESYSLRGSFPDGKAYVIFQDATYDNEDKFICNAGWRMSGTGYQLVDQLPCQAPGATTTWHWDNIQIS